MLMATTVARCLAPAAVTCAVIVAPYAPEPSCGPNSRSLLSRLMSFMRVLKLLQLRRYGFLALHARRASHDARPAAKQATPPAAAYLEHCAASRAVCRRHRPRCSGLRVRTRRRRRE